MHDFVPAHQSRLFSSSASTTGGSSMWETMSCQLPAEPRSGMSKGHVEQVLACCCCILPSALLLRCSWGPRPARALIERYFRQNVQSYLVLQSSSRLC